MEGCSRHEGYFLLHSLFQYFSRIQAFWQRDPEEEATLRMRPGNMRREVIRERGQHGIAAFAIDLADQRDVLFDKALTSHLIGDHLSEGWRVEIGPLLGLNELADQWGRCDDPAQAQTRCKDFRERTHMNDVSVVRAARLGASSEQLQRGKWFTLEAQASIRIIF